MNTSSSLAVYIRCLRPKQWTKNLLVFAGIVFTSHFTEIELILRSIGGFLAFCALAGVVYIVNDIRDIEQDRQHPQKRLRPIASGAVSAKSALGLALVLLIVALAGSYVLGWPFFAIAVGYFLLNLLYCFILRHVVILDVFSISFGFIMRALAGIAVVCHVYPDIEITPWFLLCAFFLALFLAICKRRHEALLLTDDGLQHRQVLDQYSPAFLDQLVSLTATATILAYALWAALGETFADRTIFLNIPAMMLTIPFVLFGIFRYLYLVYHKEKGGAPEQLLLQDVPLLSSIVMWLVVVLMVMR